MSDLKIDVLTDWYSLNTKPFRKGIYQTQDDYRGLTRAIQGYQYWNGKSWGMFNLTPQTAYAERKSKSCYQDNYWRGLSTPS